jgi:hypothetical protein
MGQSIGMNTMRVFLHNLPPKFAERIVVPEMLTTPHSHHAGVARLVPPKRKQRAKPRSNSGWVRRRAGISGLIPLERNLTSLALTRFHKRVKCGT